MEGFWPRTPREQFLYEKCLNFMNNIKYLEDEKDDLLCERSGLFCEISNKEQVIFDLDQKLQDESELSNLWKKKMLEEENLKLMAKEQLEYEQQIELKLKIDMSKLVEQNSNLMDRLENFANIVWNAKQDKINIELEMNLVKEELALKSRDLKNAMEEKEMMVNVEATLKTKMNILETKYCEENNTLKLEYESQSLCIKSTNILIVG